MIYPRLKADLEHLKAFGADPGGGWTRPAYSPIDVATHEWAAGRFRDAGLSVRYDSAGNLIGTLAPDAGGAAAPAITIGSHLDTVERGGWLDGALGVMAGLEVARRIGEAGVPRRRPLDIVAFRDEEGRFGAYVGSRARAGRIAPEVFARMRDAAGTMLTDALAAAGIDPARFLDAAGDGPRPACYLELHVEQGPVLEAEGVPVGVVGAIVAQARLSVRFEGRPDHAGTTPMRLRADAFMAASSFASRFYDLVRSVGEGEAVGTIGIVNVVPNAGNVVPGRVTLGLEMRDIDDGRLARMKAGVLALAETAGGEAGVAVTTRIIHEAASAPMSPALTAMALARAEALGLRARTMPSGAGHDAQSMCAIAPSALLFVPSIGGRSHCPEEDTAWPDIEAGVQVLEAMAADLVSAPDPPGP